MNKNSARKFVFIILFPACFSINRAAYAQGIFYDKKIVEKNSATFSVDSVHIKKRFWLGAGELLLSEATPWIVDNNIRKVDYTHISWQTVKYNLSPTSWAWDNDAFTTNQFGHPYHGSLFYNSFRSNGYTFWQSVPASFAGSYLWETFAENQPPAPNDFINTGFGGITLGEMTYRLANKIINNRSRGLKRQISEVFALLINPVNGLTRIIDGRWGKVMGNSTERDSSNVYTEFDLGVRKFKVDNSNGSFGFYAHVRLLYGTPFENYETPFSNISVNAELGKDDSSKLNIISAYGSIRGWRINEKENVQHLLMISMNYDYINNESFFYSAQSIKLNLFSSFKMSHGFTINTSVGAGPVILAAVPDSLQYEGRNYDFCTGIGFHANFTLSIANHLFYTINYRGGWLKTINGNATDYFLHTVTSELRYMLMDGISICAEPGYFNLHANYKNYPDVDRSYPYLRISCRYSLNVQ